MYQSIAKPNRAQEAINDLLRMFETQDMPEAVAHTVIRRFSDDVDTPSAKWSLSNQLLMLMAGTEDARGFNQWKEVGRSVKKGAKAFRILAPRVVSKVDRDPTTGEEVKAQVCVGFLAVPVFRFEDTEGAEIPHHDYTPPALPPLAGAAAALGVKLTYGPFTKDFFGYYRPGEIHLCSEDATVFFHELAHAAHKRPKAASGQDPAREIVAEFVAAVLARLYGFKGYERPAHDYICHYARGKAPTVAVVQLLADVDQVLRTIFEAALAAGETVPVEIPA